MVKKYAELYLDARRALLPTEGQFASNVARELICAASGKTAEQLISDRDLYASEEILSLIHIWRCAWPWRSAPAPGQGWI